MAETYPFKNPRSPKVTEDLVNETDEVPKGGALLRLSPCGRHLKHGKIMPSWESFLLMRKGEYINRYYEFLTKGKMKRVFPYSNLMEPSQDVIDAYENCKPTEWEWNLLVLNWRDEYMETYGDYVDTIHDDFIIFENFIEILILLLVILLIVVVMFN